MNAKKIKESKILMSLPLKKIICNAIFLCCILNFYAQETNNQYGLVIEKDNQKFNYPFSEIEQAKFEEQEEKSIETLNFNKSSGDSLYTRCDLLWQDAVYGTCIGLNNSLIPYDFDNDGTPELICYASTSGFGVKGYWYILKYDPENMKYEDIYASTVYNTKIPKMALIDLMDDGQMELLYSVKNTLKIINLNDLSEINSIVIDELPESTDILQIRYADADNDGEKEIVLGADYHLLLLHGDSWEVDTHLEIIGGDFAVGNVDLDPTLETVFTHGETLEISPGGNYTIQTDFRPNIDSPTQYLELSDIDEDGLLEAIIADDWYSLSVHDIDISNEKYDVEPDLDITSLMVYDIDNDGTDEILYGDGQWGELYALDGQTGSEIWSISNPEHGTTGIAIADFDGDADKEIVWGGGCSSSGSDHLMFYGLESLQEEWKSLHIDGPFYALKVADVDEDGAFEIVTISYESNSGYNGGILTIYDALTKEIEFQSEANFFHFIWTGVYNLEVADFGNDNDLDIILTAGDTYDGKIWVVDGDTHMIEDEHEYSWGEDVREFYASTTVDFDNNNTLEIVAVNEDKLYIINGQDFTIEWESQEFSNSWIPHGVSVGNVDSDDGLEIVVCKAFIARFDDNLEMIQTQENHYRAIKLYDWNNDGILEIIAGTSEGYIEILDGFSLEILETFELEFGPVGAIEYADLNTDGINELIVTTDNVICYIQHDGNILQSTPIIDDLGKYSAIEVVDYDLDGLPNLILGSVYSVLELDHSCADCLWYEAYFEGIDPTCFDSNGMILTSSSDQSTSYYLFNSNEEPLDFGEDLGPDIYSVSAVNEFSCKADSTITLMNIVNDCPSAIEFPNVISPNNDGYNDYFAPINTKGITSLNTQIFNRWGEIVFEAGTKNFQWDANDSKDGTYYYIVSYRDLNKVNGTLTGHITVLR